MSRLMVLGRTLAAMLMLSLASLAVPAAAQSFEDWIKKLAADDFSDKLQAAEKLGDLGDGRAVPALKALADGQLFARKSDGAALIADGPRYFDATTGQGLGELPAADVEKVRVNNRLRGVIAASLSKLSLFSDDRATRLAAAKAAFANPTPETAAALERALKSEKDPEVLAAIRFSLAAAQVNAGAVADRVKAIEQLAGTADPQVRNLLASVRNNRAAPPEVLAAAEQALAAIERRLAMIGLLENVFQGISLGSVLLLAAVGLAITFGVMGVINMAHGEMIMLGAYTAYTVQLVCRALLPREFVGFYLVISLPVAFMVAGAVGVLLERGVIRYLYGRPLETMLATWGISLVLQQAVRSIFDAQNKEVANPEWMTGGFDLMGGFFVAWNRLYIIIFCFLMLGVIALILRRTAFGLHMRAVTQNRDMASAMGIPTARVDALTFGLGSGLAGMAGVALSQIGNVSPNLGQIYIVDSFLVVVFGGVGNLLGTLVASLSLGVINKILEPFAGAVLGKVAVLVFIILFIQWRPRSQGSLLSPGGWLAFLAIGFVLIVALPVANRLMTPGGALHLPDYLVPLIGKYCCYAMLAVAMDLIWGYAGILSLGQGAFFALGGYCMGMYLMRQIGDRGVYKNPVLPDFMVFLNWKELPWYWHGFDMFWFAALMVVLVPAALAFVLGWLAFRSRVTGVYLSIITQAMTFALMLAFFRNNMGFGGNNGLTDFKDLLGFPIQTPSTRVGLLIASAVGLGLSFLLCRWIVASKLGRLCLALRDAESRVRFLGYSPTGAKLFVFVVAAMISGLAGALYVPQVGIINPGEFSPANSIEIAIWVAVGGRGTLVGAILGAFIVNIAKTWLTGAAPEIWLFFLGALFIVVTLFLPHGVVGLVRQWRARRAAQRATASVTASNPSDDVPAAPERAPHDAPRTAGAAPGAARPMEAT